MNSMKVLGISDERTTCECCGRTNLKSTVVIENIETHQIVYWGSTCATKVNRLLKGSIKAAQVQHDTQAQAKAFILKWLGEGYSPEKVAVGLQKLGGFEYRDERFFYAGRIIVYMPRIK